MPNGKPAGVRCVQLTEDNLCALYDSPERPLVCTWLRPNEEMCGQNFEEATADLYHGRESHHPRHLPPNVTRVALRKLDILNAAHSIEDLREPPGNHLEALKGDRLGFYSIQVNNQWRIVFSWENNNAYEVELVDYH